MKAFAAAIVAIAVITVGANWALTSQGGFSSAEQTSRPSVRLPGE